MENSARCQFQNVVEKESKNTYLIDGIARENNMNLFAATKVYVVQISYDIMFIFNRTLKVFCFLSLIKGSMINGLFT